MRTMPASGKWNFRLRSADCGFGGRRAVGAIRRTRRRASLQNRNDVDLSFAKAQRGLNGFDKTHAIFRADYNPILNYLPARTKPFDFLVRIDAHNFIVDPNAKVTLLLEEIEEIARLRFCGNADPKCDQDCLAV